MMIFMDNTVFEVLFILVGIIVITSAIQTKNTKKGVLMVVSYSNFPFPHTIFTFATNSESIKTTIIEGNHTDLKTLNSLVTTVNYFHLPFHFYDTLESVKQD